MSRDNTVRRRFRHARRSVGKKLVDWIGPLVLRSLARTWKTTLIDEHNFIGGRGEGGGSIVALWHGRMLLGLPQHALHDWHVLVSPSRDGDISESLLQRFRYKVIRGSSSRGGARALREMVGVLRTGALLIITPDGPRGPRHAMNPGLAWLARATGYPVVPVGFGVDRAWRMKSWDRFTIPRPWAHITITFGEPVHIARAADEATLENATVQIKERMLASERKAFAHLALEPDW